MDHVLIKAYATLTIIGVDGDPIMLEDEEDETLEEDPDVPPAHHGSLAGVLVDDAPLHLLVCTPYPKA